MRTHDQPRQRHNGGLVSSTLNASGAYNLDCVQRILKDCLIARVPMRVFPFGRPKKAFKYHFCESSYLWLFVLYLLSPHYRTPWLGVTVAKSLYIGVDRVGELCDLYLSICLLR